MTDARNLESARATRAQIAQVFDKLERHELTLTELLETPPQCMGNVEVHELLRRSPKLDKFGTRKVLRSARVDALKTLKELTHGDKQAIIAHLPPRAKGLN